MVDFFPSFMLYCLWLICLFLGKGMSNFSKSARSLFMEIQKIDSNYYPEVGGFH